MYLVLGKWSNWPKNWNTCSLVPLLQFTYFRIFGYLAFLPFYGSRYMPRRLFLVNFGRFLPKIAVSAHIGIRKMAKTPNIKKAESMFCSRGTRLQVYQFLGQLDHFPRTRYIFRRNFFFQPYARISTKIIVFGQKTGIFRPILLKFWEFIKTT